MIILLPLLWVDNYAQKQKVLHEAHYKLLSLLQGSCIQWDDRTRHPNAGVRVLKYMQGNLKNTTTSGLNTSHLWDTIRTAHCNFTHRTLARQHSCKCFFKVAAVGGLNETFKIRKLMEIYNYLFAMNIGFKWVDKVIY